MLRSPIPSPRGGGDPRDLVTEFTYNGFGEVVSESSPDRGSIAYAHDRRGLVISRTDGRGVSVGYSYDNGGRLTGIDHPPGGIGDISLTWDQPYIGAPPDANKGHIGEIDDGTVILRFNHAVLSTGPRVQTRAIYPAGRIYATREHSDFEGNVFRTIYPSGRDIRANYDDDGRLLRLRLLDGDTWTTLVSAITYAPNGPMVSALYGDGFTQTRTYDLSYRLTGITDANGGTVLRQLGYAHDQRDNLGGITDVLAPLNSESFTYTAREHLMSATGPYGALAFAYDGVGNRLTYTASGVSDSYSYPPASNRLSGITLGAGGARSFGYDGAGNVVSEDRNGTLHSYSYDAAGRLSTLSIGGSLVASYRYDAMGRQVIRTLPGGTIHSVFDSQGRRIAEYDEASGALIREYVWMDWDPVAVIEGGVVYYVRADHIGRPAFATDATGAVVWSASYLPFGEVRVSTGPLPPMRFPGQWFQSESGLHQNWMRDYDPTMGRYLQADPLGLVDGATVYGYARQNPGRWVDPRGEQVQALAPLVCVGPQAVACAAIATCVGIAGALLHKSCEGFIS